MATYQKFHQYIEDLHKGVHDFSADTLKVALTNVAPVAANSVLADLTQISYTNLSSRTLTGVTCEQVSGTIHLTADDLLLTASGGTVATFKYIAVYNDTATGDPLICWFAHSADISLLDGEEFLIQIPTDLFTAS
jgi:hypothetical protein